MSVVAGSIPQLTGLIAVVKDLWRLVCDSHTGTGSRAEFISYLREVITSIEAGQRRIHGADAKAIQEPLSKLRCIIERLSPRSQSLAKRARCLLVSNGYLIEEARKEIDDTLKLIQLRAALADESDIDRQTYTRRRTSDQGTSTYFKEEQIMAPVPQICACGLKGQPSLCASVLDPSDDNQELEDLLIAAYQDCLQHRGLAANDPAHLVCLASSLNRLAKLLRKAGQSEEATRHNREAVKIYQIVAGSRSRE